MQWYKKQRQARHAAIVVAICLGLATPVLAGTVYSWRTEDGTFSFTDDEKQVPAKYKAVAESKRMGKLKSYERYTAVSKSTRERGEGFVASSVDAAAPLAPGAAHHPMATIVGPGGRTAFSVPIDASTGRGPVEIETMRVRPKGSMATRHVTVIKQDGKIIQVRKGQMNQRDYMGIYFAGKPEEEVLEGGR